MTARPRATRDSIRDVWGPRTGFKDGGSWRRESTSGSVYAALAAGLGLEAEPIFSCHAPSSTCRDD
jgi:hypothetical protein